MSPKLDLLRSVELDDFLELELENLQHLATLCNSAIVQVSKQQVEEHRAKRQRVEDASRTELLLHEPTVNELYAFQPVKLNVGGTYFATSLENLLKEAGTFFSVLFGGRWEPKINPKDDVVFIDRSPAMFGIILDYLRTGSVDISELSPVQTQLLRVEVDFYQISSMLALLMRVPFDVHVRGNIELSKQDSIATNKQAGNYSYAISSTAFSPTELEKSVTFLAMNRILIGVAPRDILSERKHWGNCGWYLFSANGKLCGSDGKAGVKYGQPIDAGSTVTIKMDDVLNIRFVVNGKDRGVAYEKVVKDFTSTPLYLSMQFLYDPKDLNRVVEGAVQLVCDV